MRLIVLFVESISKTSSISLSKVLTDLARFMKTITQYYRVHTRTGVLKIEANSDNHFLERIRSLGVEGSYSSITKIDKANVNSTIYETVWSRG